MIRIIGIFLFTSFLFTQLSFAKDLSRRLGVGYANQFSEDLNSVAVRYWPNEKLGVGAALGVDTEEDASKFGFYVRLYRIIFTEDNMNFYMGTAAGLLSRDEQTSPGSTSYKNESGFELQGFVGGEFFLTGLESLSLIFEAGVAVTSISSETRFRTMGDSPIRAGMIFYF